MKYSPSYLALVLFFCLYACTDTATATDALVADQQSYAPSATQTAGLFDFTSTTNATSDGFVKMTDPKEGAFSILMPQGWNSQIALERPEGQVRICGASTSPDGSSRIFFGDPNMPTFMVPNPQMGMNAGMQTGSRMLVILPYMPADQFAADYAKRCYGQLPGFTITQVAPNQQYQAEVAAKFREVGLNPRMSAAFATFEFTYEGKQIRGRINSMTAQFEGTWVVEVNGFTTSGDPAATEKILNTVIESHQTNPQWQQQENMRNQQQMAQSNANHQQRMNNLKQNFNSHQNMMQQRYSAADAQHQNWQNNQAAQDQQHSQYMDYVRGQENVTNGTQSGKVDAGYNNYYVDPNTGQYIGTDSYTNPDPGTYEQWEKK